MKTLVKMIAGMAMLAGAAAAAGYALKRKEAEEDAAKRREPNADSTPLYGCGENCAEESCEVCANDAILASLTYNETMQKLCNALRVPYEELSKILNESGVRSVGEGDMGEPLYCSEEVVRVYRKWQYDRYVEWERGRQDEGEAIAPSTERGDAIQS